MLAGRWRAEHGPALRHPLAAGAGSAGLSIRLPLDPLSKLLTIEHAGYSEELCHHGNLNTFLHPRPSQPTGSWLIASEQMLKYSVDPPCRRGVRP